jgi:GAF domain-containing protein
VIEPSRPDPAPEHPQQIVPAPRELAETFAEIGRQLAAQVDTLNALDAVLHVALDRVPAVRWASVTRSRDNHYSTMVATDQVARNADKLQYDLGDGPCIDAVVDETVFVSNDLSREPRWGPWGREVVADLGVNSVLSVRLVVDGGDDVETGLSAGLNLYGEHRDAFDPESRTLATLLATHAAVAVGAVIFREQARHMQHALDSNREIGVAMGVLMGIHKVSREHAFDLLRIASQNSNRKLRDIAAIIAETGELDLPGAQIRQPPPAQN